MSVAERMEEIKRKLRQVFNEEQSEAILSAIDLAYNELVKVSDFNELKQIVKELAEAQKRTGERVEELAEAQKQSEKRLTRLEEAVTELAEAQKRTEKRVEELAEAQKQSEKRLTKLEEAVAELAEAQKQSEKRLTKLEEAVRELAEAQRRTENELFELVKEHKKTRQMLAGLSDTVGYGLEDKAMLYMPSFCKKEYGIDVNVIDRRNVVYPDGRFDEINIYIEGQKNGKKVYVIGECKARPGKKEIDSILKVAERLRNYLKAEVYPFIIGFYYSPDVEEYLKKKETEIKALKSFELEMKYRQG